MVLKQCLNALFSVLYGEMLFGTIGYKELNSHYITEGQYVAIIACIIMYKDELGNLVRNLIVVLQWWRRGRGSGLG